MGSPSEGTNVWSSQKFIVALDADSLSKQIY